MPEATASNAHPGAGSGPGEHRALAVTMDFEEVLSKLRFAIAQEQCWIIHEINPQQLLRKEGHEIRGARQLLFFHPRFMVKLLARDPRAVIEAPLKLVVWEQPDGSVTLTYHDPAARFAHYLGLTELGEELRSVVIRIVESLGKSDE